MKRHPFDVVSLVVGLAALAAAGTWAGWEYGWIERSDLALAAPIALVVVGLAALAAATLGGVDRE